MWPQANVIRSGSGNSLFRFEVEDILSASRIMFACRREWFNTFSLEKGALWIPYFRCFPTAGGDQFEEIIIYLIGERCGQFGKRRAEDPIRFIRILSINIYGLPKGFEDVEVIAENTRSGLVVLCIRNSEY